MLVTAECGEGPGRGAVGAGERHLTPGGSEGLLEEGGCPGGNKGRVAVDPAKGGRESVLQAEREVGVKVLK